MAWTPRTIVAGTNYTDSARGPVREALRLAHRFGGSVRIVHIADAEGTDRTPMDALIESLDVPSGVEVTGEIRAGKVADTLAAYVEKCKADLLCVGPRAHGFIEKHIIGGVAEQLLSRTRVPTLASAGPAARGYHTVLVAVDLGDASAKAIEVATTFVNREDGRQIIAFHALSGRGVKSVSDGAAIQQSLVKSTEVEVREFVRKHSGLPDSRIDVAVRIGPVDRHLPEVIDTEKPDLVCMGTVGRRGIVGLLAGNSAERMIRTLGIPLLISHP